MSNIINAKSSLSVMLLNQLIANDLLCRWLTSSIGQVSSFKFQYFLDLQDFTNYTTNISHKFTNNLQRVFLENQEGSQPIALLIYGGTLFSLRRVKKKFFFII